MLVQSQYDSYQLTLNLDCELFNCAPSTDEAKRFTIDFANATATIARDLAVGERFVYSSCCQRHATSLSDTFFLMPGCGGPSLEQALLTFVEAERAALPQAWIDEICDCEGCGAACCWAETACYVAVPTGACLALVCCVLGCVLGCARLLRRAPRRALKGLH